MSGPLCHRVDLAVLGAGPAGGAAALAASRAGLRVALIDENPEAGGQVWRKPVRPAARSAKADPGEALRADLRAGGLTLLYGRTVWSVGASLDLDLIDGESGRWERVSAGRLVAAGGAHERVVPFPGWTLPGVVGLAGATILLKSHGVAPGRRVLVAGCGPLLFAVAAGLAGTGIDVVGVADLAARGDWLRAMPSLLTRPGLLGQGARWMASLRAAGIPVFFRHALRRAEGATGIERAVIGPVDAEGAPAPGPEHAFAVDALCVGNGLVPGAEVTRLLRAPHRFDRLRGGLVPVTDEAGRTGIPGLYAVGDGAGLRGAAMAALGGEFAGLAAAADAGRLASDAFAREAARLRRAMARERPFSDGMAGMMRLRPAQVRAIPPETVVCRCEDVTRAEIDAAVEAGARDVNQMKQFTRCGMGPCQGRMCGDVAAELVAARVGPREAVGSFTARPPLRPIGFDELMGDFDYADIPIPEPAPL
ncbi:FAD-dependent oxidoreductase [Methylobacterium terricola]|uniref:FAD-dependent oxidoreductase n=1 Tax=Methylobacterium terricola TaxID=2583531 RepID=A0A5C4LER0_9HYPH|nr:NAD(P)/FAD-dependent oxidoreductase [Methylobacterium terricola]TNC10046.1 FAD-dependent oxidoreductase [Methylobacterium terricola]